jgi:hypothetical protein
VNLAAGDLKGADFTGGFFLRDSVTYLLGIVNGYVGGRCVFDLLCGADSRPTERSYSWIGREDCHAERRNLSVLDSPQVQRLISGGTAPFITLGEPNAQGVVSIGS